MYSVIMYCKTHDIYIPSSIATMTSKTNVTGHGIGERIITAHTSTVPPSKTVTRVVSSRLSTASVKDNTTSFLSLYNYSTGEK